VHRQFVRIAARHPFLPCFIDPNAAKQTLSYGRALAGSMCLARRLHPLLDAESMVALWLPPSTGGAVANIALALLGKTSVNLNYTSSAELNQSAVRQCGLRRVITSRTFTERVKIDPGPGVELVYLEDFRGRVSAWQRV